MSSIKRQVKRRRKNELAKAFKKGFHAYYKAAQNGQETAEDCPYGAGTGEAVAWQNGMEYAARGKKI